MASMMDDKRNHMAHDEDVETGQPTLVLAGKKHGDRALSIVGTGRVELTDEDVNFTPFLRSLPSY